eukprot:1188343-Rhodomonas_salina.2
MGDGEGRGGRIDGKRGGDDKDGVVGDLNVEGESLRVCKVDDLGLGLRGRKHPNLCQDLSEWCGAQGCRG